MIYIYKIIVLLIATNQLFPQEGKRLGIATQRSILTIENKPFSRAITNLRLTKGDTLEIYLESKNHYKVFYKNKYGWINKRKVREMQRVDIISNKEESTPKRKDFLATNFNSNSKEKENSLNVETTNDQIQKNNLKTNIQLTKKQRIRIRVNKNLARLGINRDA